MRYLHVTWRGWPALRKLASVSTGPIGTAIGSKIGKGIGMKIGKARFNRL
jgi:hypothetical protein